MPEILNTEKLSQDVSKRYVPFLSKLLAAHPGQIRSAFICGSATDPEFNSKESNINSVIVFNELAFDHLKKSLKIINDGIRNKVAAPLFVTQEYILSSLDVFPIEFLDMKENNVLLYGEDVLSGLDIQGEHIRLFCEQQIKGKLIRIRQAYLEVGLKTKGMEALLKTSLSALIPIFRNVIRLAGKTPPVKHVDIIKGLCAIAQLDENVLLPIYKDRTNDERIANQDVSTFFGKYVNEIEKLAAYIDKA